MSDMLTQEEIDALMSGNSDPSEENEHKLTQDEIDIIGEVGNISMSQAATTLSSLLNLLNSGDILKKSRIISDPSISLMASNSTFGGKTSNGTDHPFSSVYNVSKTNNSTNSVHSDFTRDSTVCADFTKFNTNPTCGDYGNFSKHTQDSNTCSRRD